MERGCSTVVGVRRRTDHRDLGTQRDRIEAETSEICMVPGNRRGLRLAIIQVGDTAASLTADIAWNFEAGRGATRCFIRQDMFAAAAELRSWRAR